MSSKRNDARPASESMKGLGFKNAHSEFVIGIEALRSTFPLTLALQYQLAKNCCESMLTFLSEKCKPAPGSIESPATIPISLLREYRRADRRSDSASRACEILARTFVVSAVSEFDILVGRLARHLLKLEPRHIASERRVDIQGIMASASREELIESFVELDVDGLLRRSHVEQFAWFESKLNCKMRIDLPKWPDFVEITQRRNLFVHNDGCVSEQYLSVCHENKVSLQGVARGDRLSADADYIQNCHRVVLEIGTKLAQVVWRRTCPDELEFADGALNELGYELILDGEYSTAAALFDFGLKPYCTLSSDEFRCMFLINLAQAYKWAGNHEMASTVLKKHDWRHLAPKYQLCDAVLRDDFDAAERAMHSAAAIGDVKENDYCEWPVFREFRETRRFRDAFERIFRKPFGGPDQEDRGVIAS